MLKPALVLILLLTAGVSALWAQDHPATPVDGPVVKADSLGRSPGFSPLTGYAIYSRIRMPGILAPIGFESKEQRAARINAATGASVLESVSRNLDWSRPPHLSAEARIALIAARLFLSNPFGFREGTVPLMNPSNPFVFAATPGWAPYESPYSPDRIPQTVRTEYDFATGTYKVVARPWSEVETDLSRSFSGSTFRTAPVPQIYLTPTERALAQ